MGWRGRRGGGQLTEQVAAGQSWEQPSGLASGGGRSGFWFWLGSRRLREGAPAREWERFWLLLADRSAPIRIPKSIHRRRIESARGGTSIGRPGSWLVPHERDVTAYRTTDPCIAADLQCCGPGSCRVAAACRPGPPASSLVRSGTGCWRVLVSSTCDRTTNPPWRIGGSKHGQRCRNPPGAASTPLYCSSRGNSGTSVTDGRSTTAAGCRPKSSP